jgi:hypothetical protein
MELVLHPNCLNCKYFNNARCLKGHDLRNGIKNECSDFEVDLQLDK